MRCTEAPDIVYGAGLGSNYQGQRLRLSKQFTGTPDGEDEDDARRVQPRLDISPAT